MSQLHHTLCHFTFIMACEEGMAITIFILWYRTQSSKDIINLSSHNAPKGVHSLNRETNVLE